MMHEFLHEASHRPSLSHTAACLTLFILLLAGSVAAQTAAPPTTTAPTPAAPTAAAQTAAAAPTAEAPKTRVVDGFAVHQSIDLGGRILNLSGSGEMYDTVVNLHSGPRVLSQTLEMHAVGKTSYPFFDSLTTMSTGYGGDPYNVTVFRMSKGKLYDFQGLFRRDRQYFDYDLLDNPLVPTGVTTTTGYTFPQVQTSPHLFNTVRRMTDVNLTMLPISRFSFRAGYSQNIAQGPSYSSIHQGSEALLLQNWRNSTDSWLVAVDWKPLARTSLTLEEYVTHYKGDTSWQLAGLNMQLSDGTPVTLGFDTVALPSCGNHLPAITSNTTTPPTANATCNGYLAYTRNEPTRTLFPTEELRFQSSYLTNLQMNGRIRYTGASMNLSDYNEYFNGLESRVTLRAATITGNSKAERINVSADYGLVWQFSKNLALSEQYDFWNFRQPADNYLSEVDQDGSSMLAAPGAALAPAVSSAHNFLGQKTQTNIVSLEWQNSSRASLSIGYRYRARTIDRSLGGATDALPMGTTYAVDIHENGGLLGIALRPVPQMRINGNFEALWADRTYTQISPRTMQHYKVRTTYKPRDWATISGAFNDLERRNNVLYVNHLDHSRNASAGLTLMPGDRYGIAMSYGYVDVFSRTGICYLDTPAGAVGIPPGTACGTNVSLGNGYYNAPTQYGEVGINLAPVKALRSSFGYRMSAATGSSEKLNPRDVEGSLQSEYQSPYANVAWTLAPGLTWRGDWNYYGYGEGGAVGPTAPRAFHGNLYTLAFHYDF